MDFLKTKAEELVRKFQPILPHYNVNDNLQKSKQCASICINEILLHLEEFPQLHEEQIEQQNYLQALNDKIQKL